MSDRFELVLELQSATDCLPHKANYYTPLICIQKLLMKNLAYGTESRISKCVSRPKKFAIKNYFLFWFSYSRIFVLFRRLLLTYLFRLSIKLECHWADYNSEKKLTFLYLLFTILLSDFLFNFFFWQ